MMRAFFKYDYILFVMCRGLGKTFIAALCLVIYCILYPNTSAGCLSASFRQAKLVIQEKYYDEIKRMSPFIASEEKSFVCNNAQAKITWFNGSKLEAFPCGIGSGTNAAARIRGSRLNLALCDEAAYINPEIIDGVLIPMLIVDADYHIGGDKKESSRNNKLVMTSSASYRFNHLYKRYVEWTKKMLEPDNTQYFTMSLPWQVGVAVGLFREDFIMQQKETMSKERFEQEYEGIFSKLVDGTWVSYQDINECSDLQHIETSGVKGFEYIMSVDVARVKGGDNSIIKIFKLHWFKDHVECDLVYTKSMNGVKFSDQARVIRGLLKKFPNIIRVYLDANGLGVGLVDELAKDYYDDEESKWYPPLLDMNNDEQMHMLKEGTLSGLPIIYGIKATAEINHNMGMNIKTFTQKKWLHMYPLSADEQRKVDLSMEEDRLLFESEETRMEILNIKNKPINGSVYVKFYSTSGRKDRWSAMCMGLYGAQLLFKERNQKDKEIEMLAGVSKRR